MFKNQKFYVLLTAGLLMSVSCFAVDFLQAEDEVILKEGNTVKDTLLSEESEVTLKNNVPSRGEALHSVAVPDEINEKAQRYNNEVLLNVNKDTPRTFEYPIGKERKEREEWRFQWYDMDAMQAYKKQEVDTRDDEKRALYRQKVNDCNEKWQEQFGIEFAMLEEGNRYDNAAYLSETLQNIEFCYKDAGYDIIDHLYGGNEDTVKRFEEEIKQFHVDSSDPSFNAKYCEDFCSVQAIAQMQLEKFSDFRVYLGKMIKEAPMIDVDITELPVIDGDDEEVLDELEAFIDNEVTPAKENNNDIIYVDDNDVPLIDEDF